MYIDVHCHLDSSYYENIDNIINNTKENGVLKMIYNGCDLKTNKEVIELINKYDCVYGAIGFHPTELDNIKEEDYAFLEDSIKNKKIVAIGEIGLDYHYEDTDREKQRYHFIRQLELAMKYNLPVIIHSRDSIQDTYDILIHVTTDETDACKFSREYSLSHPEEDIRFYSCGGDGTLGEIVNGIVGIKNASVTCFPCGSGNDFVKSLGGKERFLNIEKLGFSMVVKWCIMLAISFVAIGFIFVWCDKTLKMLYYKSKINEK